MNFNAGNRPTGRQVGESLSVFPVLIKGADKEDRQNEKKYTTSKVKTPTRKTRKS